MSIFAKRLPRSWWIWAFLVLLSTINLAILRNLYIAQQQTRGHLEGMRLLNKLDEMTGANNTEQVKELNSRVEKLEKKVAELEKKSK